MGGVFSVRSASNQMVGIVQRNERLGVFCRLEDPGGIFDAHGLVTRCVEDQQRLSEIGNGGGEVVCIDIFDELPLYRELPAAEGN